MKCFNKNCKTTFQVYKIAVRIPLWIVLITASGIVADAQCNPVQVHKLLPNDGGVGHKFGRSLHLVGTMAIIGSYDGDGAGGGDGAAYLFNTVTGQQLRKWTLAQFDFGRSALEQRQPCSYYG